MKIEFDYECIWYNCKRPLYLPFIIVPAGHAFVVAPPNYEGCDKTFPTPHAN